MTQTYTCKDCGTDVDNLEVFPGPRCLDCHKVIFEPQFARMTAKDVAQMWTSRAIVNEEGSK